MESTERAVETFIKYLYEDQLDVADIQHAFEVLRLAKEVGFVELERDTAEYIGQSMNPNNACE